MSWWCSTWTPDQVWQCSHRAASWKKVKNGLSFFSLHKNKQKLAYGTHGCNQYKKQKQRTPTHGWHNCKKGTIKNFLAMHFIYFSLLLLLLDCLIVVYAGFFKIVFFFVFLLLLFWRFFTCVDDQNTFLEELVIKPLAVGKVYSHFQFTNRWTVNETLADACKQHPLVCLCVSWTILDNRQNVSFRFIFHFFSRFQQPTHWLWFCCLFVTQSLHSGPLSTLPQSDGSHSKQISHFRTAVDIHTRSLDLRSMG